MNMDEINVINKLTKYITVELLKNNEYALKPDEVILADHLLELFDLASLGVFIEVEFSLYFTDMEMLGHDFATVGTIADAIISRLP